jgi:Asp-tRNA(Asn)/Glu-tRNA(Gln) amidotransferase C subunit
MQLEEIKKLALMARLDMSSEEMAEIASSFDGILAYVGHVQEVQGLTEVVAN